MDEKKPKLTMEEKIAKYAYAYGRGRSSFDLSETDVRYAMENTKSNMAAARFLNVSYPTYKKYAKMYKDRETGKTLFELHLNPYGVGINKNVTSPRQGRYQLDNILKGEHPNYPTWKLRNRLLALEAFPDECSTCGYNEKRITDETVPLLLDHIDGDETNHRIDNLRLLCLNCWYQEVGNPFKEKKERFWNYNLMG